MSSRLNNEEIMNTMVETQIKWNKIFHLKRIFLLLLIPVSFLILLIVKVSPKVAEYIFAQGIYRFLSQGLSLLTGWIPFSIMELMIIFIPIIVLFHVIRFIYRLKTKIKNKQTDVWYFVVKSIINTACIFSVTLFLYVIFGGVNYYRYSFSTFSGLEIKESTVEELYLLNLKLAKEAADIRSQLQLADGMEDERGVLKLDISNWRELIYAAEEAFHKSARIYPLLAGNYGPPKPVFFSRFMSRMEITGIFWPFTMEANINVDASEYSIPATIGHELAHLRGFMREDEANFIAYLICKESENLVFRYSGTMLALSYARNQLYKNDPELYRAVGEHYNEGMVADLRDEYYYWKQFEDTIISTLSNTMNDTYLKANNQHDGVKSYGRMVDLLLAEYRKEQGIH